MMLAMFVRLRRGGPGRAWALQIVENRRERGRRRQRVIGTLGRRDRLVLDGGRTLDQLLRSLLRWRERLRGPQPVRRPARDAAVGTVLPDGGRVVDEGCVSYPAPWDGGGVGPEARAMDAGVAGGARANEEVVDLVWRYSIGGIEYGPGRVIVSPEVAAVLREQDARVRKLRP
jgi:hypothetical protein